MERRAAPGAHGVRQARLGYYRRRDTPAFYAALFLLTSSAELRKRTANCFYRQASSLPMRCWAVSSPHDYALFSAAKGLYHARAACGNGPCRPDIVDAEVFRMIVNATLVTRYGLPVLDIRARRARV